MSNVPQPQRPVYAHPVAPPRVERAPDHDDAAPAKDARTDDELRADIQRRRDELAQTLDALEYKLDVPARGREFLDQGKRQLLQRWDDNPLLVAGIAAGAVVALAGAIVGIVALSRRGDGFDD